MHALPQVQRSGTGFHFSYKGMLMGLGELWREGGVRALFKGSLARILFQAPMTAVCMSTYEVTKNALAELGSNSDASEQDRLTL